LGHILSYALVFEKRKGAHTKDVKEKITTVFYSILCSAKKGVKIEGFKEHTKEKIITVFYAKPKVLRSKTKVVQKPMHNLRWFLKQQLIFERTQVSFI